MPESWPAPASPSAPLLPRGSALALAAALAAAGCEPDPAAILGRFEARYGPFESCGAIPADPEPGAEATAEAADAGGEGSCLLAGWPACDARSAARDDLDPHGRAEGTHWYLVSTGGECDVVVFNHGADVAGRTWMTRTLCEDLVPQPIGEVYLPFALDRCGLPEDVRF
ncbi:hypothetical protein L6R50_10065 [Myxococcota bacterium]|nr:hypothetical protein [Myxococcota bacterium]